MSRFLVIASIEKFVSAKSGDISGEGEFYFKCKGKRLPDDGEIHLKKNEVFDPEPNLVIYSAIMDGSKKEVKFDFQVWEADTGRDDKFIEKDFKLPLHPLNEAFDLTDKKKSCVLTVHVKIEETKTW